MSPANLPITIEQGATFQLRLRWRNSSGALVDLSGCSARMLVTETFGTGSLALDSESGDIILGGADATIFIQCSATRTAAIGFSLATYFFEITDPNGVVLRVLEGNAKVSPEVAI